MIPALHLLGVDLADEPDRTVLVRLIRVDDRATPFRILSHPAVLGTSRTDLTPPMPKKFSDLVVADVAAIADVAAKREALRLAEAAVKKTTAAVIEALDTQPSQKAAIVNPDGTVSVYSVLYGSYYVSTISGDFEIVEPAPEPEPSDEDDEDLDDEDFDDEDEDLDDEDEDEDFRL